MGNVKAKCFAVPLRHKFKYAAIRERGEKERRRHRHYAGDERSREGGRFAREKSKRVGKYGHKFSFEFRGKAEEEEEEEELS
ncbi:hypothetical protein RUM44_007053 [Polyplax serrata]|uniref:Uncharacterized protein n=1 Tax=Polyplax serrata TaxID=468196 RepID=A0ABR1B1H8_POLSC